MKNKKNFIVVIDPEGGVALSPEMLKEIIGCLDGTAELSEKYREMEEKTENIGREKIQRVQEEPDIEGLSETLMELLEKAEAYRDMLNQFLSEGDAFLDALSDLDSAWEDRT